MVNINNDWDIYLKEYFESDEYRVLREQLKLAYSQNTVFPSMYDIFNALKLTSFANTKVVILGQDPYHNDGEAHGLCFSVQKGIKVPPSLNNIFKEMQADIGTYIPNNGFLEKWSKQGVLLLNTILTVNKNQPMSHKNLGWQHLTNLIISLLNQREAPVIFVLWGSSARQKKIFITSPQHFVIESAHPSPLSCYNGFLGSRPFSKINEILVATNKSPIDWQIENI